MKEIVVYVHGKGGSAQEAEHYKALFPDCEVIGFDYRAQAPYKVRAALLPVPLNPAPFGRFSHAPHRQADGRTQRPFSSVDHGQRKWLI